MFQLPNIWRKTRWTPRTKWASISPWPPPNLAPGWQEKWYLISWHPFLGAVRLCVWNGARLLYGSIFISLSRKLMVAFRSQVNLGYAKISTLNGKLEHFSGRSVRYLLTEGYLEFNFQMYSSCTECEIVCRENQTEFRTMWTFKVLLFSEHQCTMLFFSRPASTPRNYRDTIRMYINVT